MVTRRDFVRTLPVLPAALCCTGSEATTFDGASKVCLIVGNSAYPHMQLHNPVRQATDSCAIPDFSLPLGRWIADRGFDLLNGAGLGVMLSTARAFSTAHGRKGRSIGIVPSEAHSTFGFMPLPGYPSRGNRMKDPMKHEGLDELTPKISASTQLKGEHHARRSG